MKVVLSPNPYRDRGLKTALRAREVLNRCGIETALCLPFSLDQGTKPDLPKGQDYRDMQEELKTADLLLCFGGDGTILHAAKDALPYDIPVLGVNMGSVGFMAELEHGELELLTRLAEKKYTIEHRMLLDVAVRRGREVLFRDLALNDAVVTKGAVARVIDLSVRGDGVHVYEFSGDGVILATPTGSTAYSMSAGGPIVEPSSQCLIVTPVCAHQLAARALVLEPTRRVVVQLPRGNRKHLYLSVDGGKAIRLTGGERVEITRSRYKTQLVQLSGRSFYEIINQKLGGYTP